MLPYKADVAMQRLPWANWAIIAVTVYVSMSLMFSGGYAQLPLVLWNPNAEEIIDYLDTFVFIPDSEIATYREHAGFAFYQPFTATLCHAGLWHLIGNMVFLFVFGNAVNAKIGHAKYVLFYAVFAYLTGFAWMLMPGGALIMIGASGAVMGIAGMFAMLYPLNDISMFMILWFRPIVWEMSAVWLLLIYFVLDLLMLLLGGKGVAYISHLAGTVAGGGVAALLLLSGRAKPGAGEKTLLEVFGLKVERDQPYKTQSKLSTAAAKAPYMHRMPSYAPEQAPIEPARGIELQSAHAAGDSIELAPMEWDLEEAPEEEPQGPPPIELEPLDGEEDKWE